MSITRRLFLRNSAAAGAVGATIITPTVAAEPEMSRRELAIWHMRELERLMFDGGAATVHICAIGTYSGGDEDVRLIGIHYSGLLMDRDGVFGQEGSIA